MNASNLSRAMLLLCIGVAGCATTGTEPQTRRDASLQLALDLKRACVRAHVENGMFYGTAGRINAECWHRAKLAAGLR